MANEVNRINRRIKAAMKRYIDHDDPGAITAIIRLSRQLQQAKTAPTGCSCKVNSSIFNSNIQRSHHSASSAGGGNERWIDCTCKSCGRSWTEPGML